MLTPPMVRPFRSSSSRKIISLYMLKRSVEKTQRWRTSLFIVMKVLISLPMRMQAVLSQYKFLMSGCPFHVDQDFSTCRSSCFTSSKALVTCSRWSTCTLSLCFSMAPSDIILTMKIALLVPASSTKPHCSFPISSLRALATSSGYELWPWWFWGGSWWHDSSG